jgi:hypothetical protein
MFKGKKIEGIKISYSRLSSYLSCPQKHYFSYIESLRPKGVVRPLSFGSDFHKLLQYRHNPIALSKVRQEIRNAYEELTQKEALGETYLSDLDEIFSDYLELYSDEEKPIEAEHEFLILIGKYKGEPIYFHGIIDEIYADASLGEHKTFSYPPDSNILAMNMQTTLYAKAYEIETGKKPPRIRWDYIKSKPAERPVWLSTSNRFSDAKSSKITPYSWRRACEEQGIEEDDVIDKAERFKDNLNNFFFRKTVEIVPAMVDSVWNDFKSTAKDLVIRGATNKVKNITKDCSWCNYRPICYAEFTGADADYVKKTDYTIKERVEDEASE